MDKFKNLSIKNKILFFIVSSFLIAMLILTIVVIYQFEKLATESNQQLENLLLAEEKEKVRNNVHLMTSVLAELSTNNKGELNKKEVREIIENENFRFRETTYFYMLNFNGNMIAHGAQPSLVGKNLWELKKEDQYVVQDIINQVLKKGGGFVNYPWENPVTGKLERKFSYVEQIPGTNYLLGAGEYQSVINRILAVNETDINQVEQETIILFLIIMASTTLIVAVISFKVFAYLVDNINEIVAGINQVAEGNLETQLSIRSEDEIGALAVGFNRMVQQINELTYNDLLTGLPNKSTFRNSLEVQLEKTKNTKENLFLCALAVKNFKVINDTYGHQVGDQLLKNLSERLNNNLGNEIIISRNKQEFLFYYQGQANRDLVVEKMKSVVDQAGKPYNINNQLIHVKISVGISVFPDDSKQADILIRNSSLALHSNSAGNITFYSEAMNDKIATRINLETKLRIAIQEEQFLLHYQPFIDQDNQIVGMEALIRWQHPKEGMISPGEFIPVAEETKLIVDIGDWVLEESCRQLKKWHNYGHQDLYISVNIAPHQFNKRDFLEKIKKVIAKTGIEAEKLELEITERTAVSDINYTIDILQQLKKLGVRIALDDFGTGYSSLEFLKDFAIDILKIDRSFVHQLNQNKKNQSIAETIIGMGQNLDLEVVAEGVETKAEQEFLLDKGCDIMQGYLFSRAVSKDRFLELLKE